jgi:uncharacterized metal-binding protein YceD (DUF177 family)
MPDPKITHPLRISDIPKAKNMPFDVTFTPEQMISVAALISAASVKKMRIQGKISPSGNKDWVLNATVGATVIQPCVVTLEPVQTRVDTTVHLTYAADFKYNDTENVVEMTEDETIEPLSDEIDLATIAIEAIVLALPDYPRASDAKLETAVFTKPGDKPMTDEDAKPFASLAELKDKLTKEGK